MQNDDLLAGLFGDAQDLFIILDGKRRLALFNPAFGRAVAGAIEGVDFKDLIPEASRERVLGDLAKAAGGERVTTVVPHSDVDGRNQEVEYRFFPLQDMRVGGMGRIREQQMSDREALSRAESELQSNKRMLDEIQLELTQVPFIDPVTGVWNRMQVFERLTSEWSRCERFASPLSLMLIDVPGVAAIRAKYGAKVGDDVLKAVARRIKAIVRDHDIVGRSVGDQFVVVAVHADYEGAVSLCERIRDGVAFDPVDVDQHSIPVGVNCGGATSRSEGVEILEDLFRVADEALREASQGDEHVKVAADASA